MGILCCSLNSDRCLTQITTHLLEGDFYSPAHQKISRLGELLDHNTSEEALKSLKEILVSTIDNIVKPQNDNVVKSQFTFLNSVANGFLPSTLTIVAVRPSMGKSAFVISVPINVTLKDKVPAAFFSLEMNIQEIPNHISIST